MIRNLKMLGLALVAVCAMGAVAASAASANANYWFTAPSSDWTKLSGGQPSKFNDRFQVVGKTGGAPGITTCETTTYTGSTSATTTTTISLKPAYGGCELEPFGKATITTTGCEYVIHTDPLGDTTNGNYDTVTTIECTAGNEIKIEAKVGGVLKCTVNVPPQNLGTGITLTNTAGGGLTAAISFSTITYTQTAGTGSGACSTEMPALANGTYTGAATITGENTTGGAVAINAST